MIQAAESAGLPGRFVLVSSLLASGKTNNLSAQLLNSLGGVVDAKHASETALSSSSLDWTILRPGVFAERRQGNLVVGAADRFVGEESDRRLLGRAVSCVSPFESSKILKTSDGVSGRASEVVRERGAVRPRIVVVVVVVSACVAWPAAQLHRHAPVERGRGEYGLGFRV